MKNLTFSLCAALLCGSFLCAAADTPAPAANQTPAAPAASDQADAASDVGEKPTFMMIRNAALTQERAESIKSARVIYSIRGYGIKDASMILRAKRFDQVRLDAVCGKEHFCAVRNGDNFWYYDKQEGTDTMSKGDAQAFAQYIAFLDVPFYKTPVFSEPVFKQKDQLGKKVCYCFDVTAIDGSGATCRMWIEKKTHVLHRVENTTPNDEPVTVTYRDYKKFNGVRLPTSVYLTTSEGTVMMSLVSADWNLDLDDSIFKQKANPADSEVRKLIEAPAIAAAAIEMKQQEQKDKNRIFYLEKKIAQLKIKIADEERNAKKVESLAAANRSQSVGLASINSGNGGSFFWRGGWSRGGRDHYATNTRRKLINLMNLEDNKYKYEYKAANQRLLKMRLELNDLEFELARIKGASDAVKDPEAAKPQQLR